MGMLHAGGFGRVLYVDADLYKTTHVNGASHEDALKWSNERLLAFLSNNSEN